MKNNLVGDILFYLYCPEISVYPFSWLSSPSGFGRIHIILLSGSGGSQLLSRVLLFATPWTLGHQAPLSIGFSRWKYWSGLPFPSWPKIKPASLVSPAMAGRFFTTRRPTPALLLGKSHGRRSLVGCGPLGREESETTEWLHFHFSLSCIGEGNGNPLQCSCLENPVDRGAWGATVHGVAKCWMWLSN